MQVEELERSAALAAAQRAHEEIIRASIQWPVDIAKEARRRAEDVISTISSALEHDATSVARRRSLRGALVYALELATICDVAQAHGVLVLDSLRCTSRMLSMLSLTYHAAAIGDDT
ncbi:MAG: hypothetical protein HOV81_12270 [Kofleriaceae bacterium]|nr:hypothetical protein [Kofleriaceae bacterium]